MKCGNFFIWPLLWWLFLVPAMSWGLTPAEQTIVDKLENTLTESQRKIEKLTVSTLSLSEKLQASREQSKTLELRWNSALKKIESLESLSTELQETVKRLSAEYAALMKTYQELLNYCENLENQNRRQRTLIKIGGGALAVSIVLNILQVIL